MGGRLLVAAVGVPLLLVILLLCPPIVTVAAVAFLCCVGVWELLWSTGLVQEKRPVAYSMVLAALTPFWCFFGWPFYPGLLALAAFVTALFLEAFAAYPDSKIERLCVCLFGAVIISLFLSSIVRILLEERGRYYVLVPILIPFIADAGAYFAGRFLGKHKMAPLLSPHKTIEGAVGGVAAGVLGMIGYCLVMQLAFGQSCDYLAAVLYGLLGSGISIVGDLAFSMIKRESGIKDYGHIFGAHGGVLDRFDSVIFAAPLVEILLHYLPILQ